MGGAEGTGVLRCAQDDSKNKQSQRQEQATARTSNGKNKQRQRGMGGKVRAVWAVLRVPGSFAALRMTAKTNNGDDNRKNRSRSPSGMTTKKSNRKNRQRQEQATARTSNGKNKQRQEQAT